jgi:dihydrofolate reductase
MLISLIVAFDEGRGIGKDGKLPWTLSTDLKRFKRLTMGHHIIMGRKTYESIDRLLPGRTTIIITHTPEIIRDALTRRHLSQFEANIANYFFAVNSIDEALAIAQANGDDEAFIIGGGDIFRLSLNIADRIYLTRVHAHLECDTFFPELDPNAWKIVEESFHLADVKNQHDTTYQILEHTHGV